MPEKIMKGEGMGEVDPYVTFKKTPDPEPTLENHPDPQSWLKNSKYNSKLKFVVKHWE